VSRPDRRIALIDLDHARADQHRVLVRVLARLTNELGRPAEAELLVSRADAAWLSFPAREWTRDRAGVWRGAFAVPAAVVQRAEFGFALSTAGQTLALPHPGFPRAVQLTADPVSRLTGSRMRTRALALATALAVTTASSPALAVTTASSPALALAGPGLAPAPAGHAQAARERIEQLAVFAVERARAGAARKRARAGSPTPRSGSRQTATHSVRASQDARGGRATTVAGAARVSGSPDCLRPLAVIAGTPAATRIAAAAAAARLAARTHDAQPQIHCGTLGRTATGTPAPATVPTPPRALPGPAPAPTPSVPTTTVPPATPTGPTTTVSPTTPTVPATPTVPTPAAPAPAAPVPTAPVPFATPNALSPVAPPRLASSGHERSSRPELPSTTASAVHSVRRLGHRDPRTPHPGAPHASGAPASTLTPSPPGFHGPKSWTGTVVNDPSLQSLLGNLSAVLHDINRPPRFLVAIYMEAGRRFHVPWPVLAAINSVETDYGRNLNTSSAGAIGWMQFEPATWKQWGVAVDGHSVANPYDPRDAIFSAARYLAAAGAATDISRAILAYNHAGWYVDLVIARARAIAAGVHPHTVTNPRGIITTFFDQWRGHWRAPYRGGYLTHYTRLVAAANMVSAADFPYLWGGGHEQPARFGAFDCSGSISYVLQQAGYRLPTSTSGDVSSWQLPAGPGRVTIFYNATHTFMRIGGRYFGTSTSRPGGGAGWIGTDRLPESYLAGFREVHVPGLRGDAFAAARRHRAAVQRRSENATHPAPLRLTPFPRTTSKLQRTFPTT